MEKLPITDPIYLLAVLCSVTAVAEWLRGLPAGRWFGGAIISLLLGILLANVGLIPTVANAPPLYEYLIAVGAPVAIFLILAEHLARMNGSHAILEHRNHLSCSPRVARPPDHRQSNGNRSGTGR